MYTRYTSDTFTRCVTAHQSYTAIHQLYSAIHYTAIHRYTLYNLYSTPLILGRAQRALERAHLFLLVQGGKVGGPKCKIPPGAGFQARVNSRAHAGPLCYVTFTASLEARWRALPMI